MAKIVANRVISLLSIGKGVYPIRGFAARNSSAKFILIFSFASLHTSFITSIFRLYAILNGKSVFNKVNKVKRDSKTIKKSQK